MKYIKRLRLFENTQELSHEQRDFLDRYIDGEWVVNPNTGLVDVKGNFYCFMIGLSGFRGIKFGEVDGSFNCSKNKLTSLEGSPRKVSGDFLCYRNSLPSLKGGPQEVMGDFYCSSNKISSLEGAPKKVDGDFFCSENYITSLEGSPQKVGRGFYCDYNSLTSLEGAPEEVFGGFYCHVNRISSLEGAPQKVVGDFICDAFGLVIGEWNTQGWLKILREGTSEAKILILTLPYFDPESIQREIEKNPGNWVMYLKDVWNLEEFRPVRDQLKVSDQFLKDIGSQSGLSDLGF